ncbi:DUF1871 family protein [Peribacillus huizhouensis]|uniref:DUF1871 domain-containing protein n=1 Tax=Peribacillus huizhouensis TaxID=1501239 RepID=A0ABR6CRH9_9BACI|nr:DUF1871 family protein [Peribacillus huizhouensis]MBA9027633.1 hypothetical protein [Peribacillus huizhouensis]
MSKTKRIINKWDPMKLLLHAPDDEYEEEILLINDVLALTSDVNQVANEIKAAFIKMFGYDFKRSYNDCLEIAKKILD